MVFNMTEQKNKYQMLLTPKQSSELSAIYEDYLYMVRQYEKLLQTSSVDVLAGFQIQQLYEGKQPQFPWQLKLLDVDEKKEFRDFCNDDDAGRFTHSYISLQHTNPENDNTAPIQFIPDNFDIFTMDMQLPSGVERYIIAHPKNATIGNTEFFIDNFFKATYTNKDNANMSVSEIFGNYRIQTEFRILVNMVDICRENKYQLLGKYQRLPINLYAAETTAPWENNILEILGSFASKTQDICRNIYGDNALQCAEQDGLIPSAADFQDYVNIRNLMRHQWDTMDELGYFHSADRNASKRAEYLQSYLKLCDKTIVQRLKSYIDVLHQMQHVIARVCPKRIIRDKSDSNSRFAAMLKAYHAQNPDEPLAVELNYPLASDKYKALHRNLHKIFPQIRITEDFLSKQDEFCRLDRDYGRRAWFLQTYHALECRMMTYCITRGENLQNKAAWDYCRAHNLISPQDYRAWDYYTRLRNAVSHSFYSPFLRQKLREVEEPYIKRLNDIETKLFAVAPQSKRISSGVYQMIHNDGICVTIDYKNRKILHGIKRSELQQPKKVGKIELPENKHENTAGSAPTTESYANGVIYTLSDNRIKSVKLPNGVTVNCEKRRIGWNTGAQFHTNAEYFNVLQTDNCKLITDKELRVTEFWEKRRQQRICGGDTWMLESRHRAYIDTVGRLKEFNFKNADGKTIKTTFKPTRDGTIISFNDDTGLVLRAHDMEVTHNGEILTYENRQEFAATYNGATGISPQTVKNSNSR